MVKQQPTNRLCCQRKRRSPSQQWKEPRKGTHETPLYQRPLNSPLKEHLIHHFGTKVARFPSRTKGATIAASQPASQPQADTPAQCSSSLGKKGISVEITPTNRFLTSYPWDFLASRREQHEGMYIYLEKWENKKVGVSSLRRLQERLLFS